MDRNSTVAVVGLVLAVINCCAGYCTSPIYCRGPILNAIQLSRIFPDSKTFVDMPTKKPEGMVLAAFNSLPSQPTREELVQFLTENFREPGFELEVVEPVDWIETPPFLGNIQDSRLIAFAKALHGKWKHLFRKFRHDRLCGLCASSSFFLDHPFVVPGGRFRESYYWDTFWIMEGMIESGMLISIKGMLLNFLKMVRLFGFVPNGSRLYYLNRSQPPFLVQMIDRFYNVTKDVDFLKEALPLLDKEYLFWMTQRSTWVGLNTTSVKFKLNHYQVLVHAPRPESYKEDILDATVFTTDEERSNFFSEIIACTESGWDFSSRWLRAPFNLTTIMTSQIIPVDLNSVMWKNENALSRMHTILGNASSSSAYAIAASDRKKAFEEIFWNESLMSWKDFNMTSLEHASIKRSYASDLIPAYMGIAPPNSHSVEDVIEKHFNFLTANPSGFPSSDYQNGQQWDYPNVWAPYLHLATEFFHQINYPLALNISQRFVDTVYCGYENTGYIFEKYHADKVGVPGGGGEYIVQEGFGWTNGVVIKMLSKFGSHLNAPSSCGTAKRKEDRPSDAVQHQSDDNSRAVSEGLPNQRGVVILCILVFVMLVLIRKFDAIRILGKIQ